MKTNVFELQLQTIEDFQKEYPNSHVGGSIGLRLLGYDLKRDLNSSDLDLITPNFDVKSYCENELGIEATSDNNDFNYRYKRWFYSIYIKHDVRIDTNQQYTVVEFKSKKYNVSLFENIMKFKKEYSDKGVFKHYADIVAIETGKRPIEPNNDPFDLPW